MNGLIEWFAKNGVAANLLAMSFAAIVLRRRVSCMTARLRTSGFLLSPLFTSTHLVEICFLPVFVRASSQGTLS